VRQGKRGLTAIANDTAGVGTVATRWRRRASLPVPDSRAATAWHHNVGMIADPGWDSSAPSLLGCRAGPVPASPRGRGRALQVDRADRASIVADPWRRGRCTPVAQEADDGPGGPHSESIEVEHIATTDPEDVIACRRARGVRVRHTQLSRGPYSADLKTVVLPGLRLSLTAYAPAVAAQATTFKGAFALILPVGGTQGVSLDHRALRENEIGVIAPDREFHLVRPPAFTSVTISPDAALIDRLAEAMFGEPFSRSCRGGRGLRVSDGAAAVCARHFAQICAAAATTRKPLSDWIAVCGGPERLVDEFVDDVLAIVVSPWPVRVRSFRPGILGRAWEMIEGDEDGRMTAAQLCLRLDVPSRALDDAFRANLGMSPRRFILGMRLNKARRRLSRPEDGTTMTGVAARFGFADIGRFCRQYRRLFAELPRETLARARWA
jgi:AraC family ethanolamine operon transcriptional activator